MQLSSINCYIFGLFAFFLTFAVYAEVSKYESNGRVYYTEKSLESILRGVKRVPRLFAINGDLKKRKQQFSKFIENAAKKHGIEAKLLHAIIHVESAYDSDAVSPKGAQGLMQLMPKTAQRYNVKHPFDPEQNINGGAEYFSDLIKMFDANMRLALAAYNAGEKAVIKYGKKIPPYEETQNYVDKVLVLYNINDT